MMCPVCLVERSSVEDVKNIREIGYCEMCSFNNRLLDNDKEITEAQARREGLTIVEREYLK